MIYRDITKSLLESAQQFAAVAVLGPRQSGKTTLIQSTFKKHGYVSLEDLDMRDLAKRDPRGLLKEYATKDGIILDEIQHVPELLSYMQTIIDRENKKGFFIITGSQNILVNQAVTQTLAGRISLLTLFPLSIHELQQANRLNSNIKEVVFKGLYPRLYAEEISPTKLYPSYIHGYIERDVRQIKNILNLELFQKFMRLCAGRIGQVLNLSSLCNDCGIDFKTAQSWISLLKATYVIFLLQPYFNNFGKRLVKSPKLYFVDTGVACSLLNIKSPDELESHYLKGGLVESFVISDLFKQFANIDSAPTLSFWRDIAGNEVDCLIEHRARLTPVEIKSGRTANSDYFKQFKYLEKIKKFPSSSNNFVIYSGDEDQNWPQAKILSWKFSGELVKKLLEEK